MRKWVNLSFSRCPKIDYPINLGLDFDSIFICGFTNFSIVENENENENVLKYHWKSSFPVNLASHTSTNNSGEKLFKTIHSNPHSTVAISLSHNMKKKKRKINRLREYILQCMVCDLLHCMQNKNTKNEYWRAQLHIL